MITIFHNEHDWEIWTENDVGPKDGRCIGADKTLALAFRKAKQELLADLNELKALEQQDKERL